jgi:CheY-like chemotaxis protein
VGYLNVLIVEDYPDGADSLAALLRLWGHTARVARDGPSALPAALAGPPDVVLCDLALPGLDGYAVAASLARELPRRPLLVALTGYGTEDHRRKARDAGFDHFFLKPTNPDELRAVLAAPGRDGG